MGNIYFISDFHLGAPDKTTSLAREKKIVSFLSSIQEDASELFILGDIFDFWFEYRKVVPKGYVRLLGKIAEMSDAGIKIRFFIGNHDMWVRDYFQEELNMEVFHHPATFNFGGSRFLIGHGDGLGPGDLRYKFLKRIFRNPVAQWFFGILPPTIGMGLADFFSRRSRAKTGSADETFLGEDREWLISYCREVLQKEHYDFFIFGHRHLPIDFRLDDKSRYMNLGDWLRHDSYAVFDGKILSLKYFGK
jgi:UDP-2,3-diacylglucosamine hydrolase